MKGFSLIEMLIFSAIFAIIMVSFITILVAVTSVNARQTSMIEVMTQSQFLLQAVQYYTGRSSLIDMPQDVATTTLKLRMPATAEDPTYITLSSGIVYLKQTDSGSLQPLNSSKVTVSNLSFTKRSNAPGHDSVSVVFTVSYNTTGRQQMFTEALETAVARVSAATFDSDVIPSSTAQYRLGVSGQIWSSINGLIYFSGSNVGVGSNYSSPAQTLDVNGGVRINVSGATSTCDSTIRGTVWVSKHTANATDTMLVCVESADNTTYYWARVY